MKYFLLLLTICGSGCTALSSRDGLEGPGKKSDDSGNDSSRDSLRDQDGGEPNEDATDDAGGDASESAAALDAAADASLPAEDNRALGGTLVVPGSCPVTGVEAPQSAIDGDPATKWYCGGLSLPPLIVTYRFPGLLSFAVNSYAITAGNDSDVYLNRNLRGWTLRGSNDGVNWTELDTRSGQMFGARERHAYTFDNQMPYQQLQLEVSEMSETTSSEVQIGELELFGAQGRVNLAQGGQVSTPCLSPAYETAEHAFDNRNDFKWLCAGNATPSVVYTFADGASHAINMYSVTSGNDFPTRDPKQWVLEGSNDGSTFTTLHEVNEDQLFAERHETRAFTFTNKDEYLSYRFRVTANNGDVDFQVAEIMLFEN